MPDLFFNWLTSVGNLGWSLIFSKERIALEENLQTKQSSLFNISLVERSLLTCSNYGLIGRHEIHKYVLLWIYGVAWTKKCVVSSVALDLSSWNFFHMQSCGFFSSVRLLCWRSLICCMPIPKIRSISSPVELTKNSLNTLMLLLWL